MKYNILLAFDFAIKDFKQRYMGTGLGHLWFILSPIIMISIYAIVFSDLMSLKLNIQSTGYSYVIYLIPGIVAWTTFSTIITRLSNSFAEKSGLIKKVSVPMYAFSLSTLITEFVIFLISMFIAVVFLLIVNHPVTFTFLWLLPVMILQVLFAFSIGVILSLFVPFFKDLKVVVPIAIQLWFWTTPILYMKEMVADKYPAILQYNPFFYFIDIYHNIFLYSVSPSFSQLFILLLITFPTQFLAAFLYKKMISTIKDII